jgi:hypothetical protein
VVVIVPIRCATTRLFIFIFFFFLSFFFFCLSFPARSYVRGGSCPVLEDNHVYCNEKVWRGGALASAVA